MLKSSISTLCLLYLSGLTIFAEEKPYAFESVIGYRSDYIYNGQQLTDQAMEYQFYGTFNYDESQELEYGLWYTGGQGEETFKEYGLSLDFTEKRGSWQYHTGLRVRQLEGTLLKSGFELQLGTSYQLHQDHSLHGHITYDTGVEGSYAELSYRGFIDLHEKAFLSFKSGISATHSYYNPNGLNDWFSRATLTFNLNEHTSISSFLGSSVRKGRSNKIYAGLWLETIF